MGRAFFVGMGKVCLGRLRWKLAAIHRSNRWLGSKNSGFCAKRNLPNLSLETSHQEIEMKLWNFIDKHHEDLGVALFVLPCLLTAFATAGIVFGIGLLFR